MPEKHQTWWEKFKYYAGLGSTFHWVAHWLTVAFGGVLSGLGVETVMPYTPSHPAQYWLAITGAILGGALLVQCAWAGTSAAIPRIKRKRNPPTLVITKHSGHAADLELLHSGEAATWRATARIISVDNGRTLPPNKLWHEQFIVVDGRSHKAAPLREGDRGRIRIAEIGVYDWSPARLEVFEISLMGSYEATVEVEIKDDYGVRAYQSQYDVLWHRGKDAVFIKEVSESWS